jgi:signal transduction histidine kinase
MQHPDIAVALVEFEQAMETTPGWRESPWTLDVPFGTSQGMGRVSVAYLAPRPPADEGPFLKEERALLNSFSEMLVAYLERHVAERRRRATEHQLRQSQKMEALGTLAGGIAHDFNNILTAIVANAEMARLDLEPEHPARPQVDAVMAASARATDIVRRILLFSRRQEAEHRVIALRPVVEEALRLVSTGLPKGVTVVAAYAADLPAIAGDASQLYQVFMNILTNAGHAMQSQGGTLSIALEAVDLDASHLPSVQLTPGRYVHASITDTGTGMSAETLEHIFEPFFTTKGHGGTGLGLAVVHGIVDDHDGAITVESELGHGTTFHLWLPAAAAAAGSGEVAAATPSGNGEHILYVDDEESIVLAMERVISRLGYRCTGVTDPHEALARFRADPRGFAAVITDLSMPGMSGFQLAAELRAIQPGVPIAVASGYGESAADAVARGEITTRIHKPSSLEALAAALRELVR